MQESGAFALAEQRIHEGYAAQVASGRWLDTPMIVSIETFAKCNAACTFCPYPDLTRQGARLDRKRILALIDEVATFATPPQRLNFSRVNEPFLDPDLFSFLEYAQKALPKTQLILFSNGQTITDRVVDNLNALPAFRSLTISFNEHDPETYRQVMQLDQSRTLARLDRLHDRAEAGALRFSISLSRVGTSDGQDADFLDWCKARYPLFPASVSARFNWIGKQTSHLAAAAPDAGCLQWFSLHILADGGSAFCCIDGRGDGADHNAGGSLLTLYNQPQKRQLRQKVVSRRNVSGCDSCLHGMPAAAYGEKLHQRTQGQ